MKSLPWAKESSTRAPKSRRYSNWQSMIILLTKALGIVKPVLWSSSSQHWYLGETRLTSTKVMSCWFGGRLVCALAIDRMFRSDKDQLHWLKKNKILDKPNRIYLGLSRVTLRRSHQLWTWGKIRRNQSSIRRLIKSQEYDHLYPAAKLRWCFCHEAVRVYRVELLLVFSYGYRLCISPDHKDQDLVWISKDTWASMSGTRLGLNWLPLVVSSHEISIRSHIQHAPTRSYRPFMIA